MCIEAQLGVGSENNVTKHEGEEVPEGLIKQPRSRCRRSETPVEAHLQIFIIFAQQI